VLAAGIAVHIIIGIFTLVLPRQFLDIFGFAGEPLTVVLSGILGWAGIITVAWAAAMIFAFRDIESSRSLVKAIIAGQFIMGVASFYIDAFVVQAGVVAAADLVYILLGAMLLLVYPWKAKRLNKS